MSGLATYQFDTSIFGVVGDDLVNWGPSVFAANVQVDGFPKHDPDDDNVYPVYFEVVGLRHYYTVSAWENRVEIEVCDNDPGVLTPRSTMRPRNQSELLEALDTIGADFEELMEELDINIEDFGDWFYSRFTYAA